MTSNERLIGDKFEDIFKNKFQGFTRISSKGILPDFYHPSGFWIEAKTGNEEWGVRIKRDQIENFVKLDEPVAYCVGLHYFHKATERLNGRTERGKKNYLTRHFQIESFNFMSDVLMRKIWEKEWKLSDEGEEYCMVKKHIFNRVFYNKEFGTEKLKFSSENYYGYDSNDFLIIPPKKIWNEIYSVVLHKKEEDIIIDYLREQGIVE